MRKTRPLKQQLQVELITYGVMWYVLIFSAASNFGDRGRLICCYEGSWVVQGSL